MQFSHLISLIISSVQFYQEIAEIPFSDSKDYYFITGDGTFMVLVTVSETVGSIDIFLAIQLSLAALLTAVL